MKEYGRFEILAVFCVALLTVWTMLVLNRKHAASIAALSTVPTPGIDTDCCRDKINSGIYMVNLLRELKTNNVEIDRWEPAGTNWQLSIQQSVRNSNRMVIQYTE